MVPEPTDEAQEAAEESAGRAEDSWGAGEIRRQLQRERNDKSSEELKHGQEPDSYMLDENDDDVDIEDDICSQDHLL